MEETEILWKVIAVLLILIGVIVIAVSIAIRRRREADILSSLSGIIGDREAEEKLLTLVMAETELLTREHANEGATRHLEKVFLETFRQERVEMTTLYHDLTDHDVVAMMLIGLGLSNEMTSRLLGSSVRGFYNQRQRISKRMGVKTTDIDSIAAEIMSKRKPLGIDGNEE